MSIDDREKPAGPLVRRMIRTSRTATLATIDSETGGTPYASLVLTACAQDGSPLMLLSDLARHCRNFAADPRASLLYAKSGVEAVSQSRATVIGRIEACDDEAMRARFMRRHATSREHMAFGDFHLYRMVAESVHFIAGFGRIETLSADTVILAPAVIGTLVAAEQDIVTHMNTDHKDALSLYAHHYADRPGMDWQMTGIDPEGFDLSRHDAEARVDFAAPVANAEAARAEFVAMAKAARADRNA